MELFHVVHALQPFLFLFGDVKVGVVEVFENLEVAVFERLVFLFEVVLDVAHAEADACGLVAISWADAFSRCSHFALAFGRFISAVEHAVGWEDEVGASADVEAFSQGISSSLEFMSFSHEEVGSDDAAVADDVDFLFVEDTRRNGAEHEFLAIEDDGVSGVRAASKTSYHVIVRGEEIHHFSFAFVAEDDAQQGVYFSCCHYVKCRFGS